MEQHIGYLLLHASAAKEDFAMCTGHNIVWEHCSRNLSETYYRLETRRKYAKLLQECVMRNAD